MTTLVAKPAFEGVLLEGGRLALPRAARRALRTDSGLGVALLLSAALHGALLLVIGGFGLDAPRPLQQVEPVINVTLLRWPMPIDDAGESPLPALPELATEAVPQERIEADASVPEETAPAPQPAEPTQETAPVAVAPVVLSTNILQLAQEVAGMAQVQPTPATNTRVRRIDAAAPETVTDAYYLDAWRRKVERIGQLNYPQEARQRQLYGTLRLLVSIEPDGALRDVRLLASSGHDVLDEAALGIVRLAAPFAPFPPAMQELDLLEIDRTWRFQRTRSARLGEPSQ